MSNKIIIRKKNYVEIRNDEPTNVILENNIEIIELKTLDIDKRLSEKLLLSSYSRYIVLMCMVAHGKYNRITDKKGIWGLTKQGDGLFKGEYLCNEGKIYLGITNQLEPSCSHVLTSIFEVFIPTDAELSFENIYKILSFNQCGLLSDNQETDKVLKEVNNAIPDSMVIYRDYYKIKIFGKDVENCI